MDSIGWTMFLILVVLLVPFLPFIAIVYVLSKVCASAVFDPLMR